jgi:hypothetical protein
VGGLSSVGVWLHRKQAAEKLDSRCLASPEKGRLIVKNYGIAKAMP